MPDCRRYTIQFDVFPFNRYETQAPSGCALISFFLSSSKRSFVVLDPSLPLLVLTHFNFSRAERHPRLALPQLSETQPSGTIGIPVRKVTKKHERGEQQGTIVTRVVAHINMHLVNLNFTCGSATRNYLFRSFGSIETTLGPFPFVVCCNKYSYPFHFRPCFPSFFSSGAWAFRRKK